MVLQPNLVSGCALIFSFNVPKFQGNWIMLLSFTTTFKQRKSKQRKLKQFLKVHILETVLRNLVEIWNVR